jgi:hypothetical protein
VAISRFSDSSIQDAFPKYNSLWDGRSAVGSMDAISAITLSSAQSSITFSSIPSTYSHLQLRGIYQLSSAGEIVNFRANSDSGTNYVSHQLSGNGTAASGSSNTGETYSRVGYSAVTTASYFSTSVIDILDYANTNKYKTLRTLNGSDANGSGVVQLRSGLWMSSSAINAITLSTSAGNFNQYSSFALYGIK